MAGAETFWDRSKLQSQSQLRGALTRKGMAVESRVHLEDVLALLTEALRATLQRG